MNDDFNNHEMNEEFTSKLEALLNPVMGNGGILSSTPSTIRTAAFHDFSEYRYLMTPLREDPPVDLPVDFPNHPYSDESQYNNRGARLYCLYLRACA